MSGLPALAGVLAGWLALAQPPRAPGASLFVLSIGYNGVPQSTDGRSLVPLRYADDDAARVHAFARELGGRSRLLAVFDRETATRSPDLLAEARPPTRAELLAAVKGMAREVEAASGAGQHPTVIIYYSGHGTRAPDGKGSLTLYDGELTQELLYDQVLAPLDGHPLHLLVDACHAEATVRPRDRQAEVVELPLDQVAAYLGRNTLARFAHAGAIIASTGDALSHEWERYQGGVFTHELLSAFRGAADVNGDRQIEYSEIAAFLSAANAAISVPQARLRTVVQPPPANPRAALVNLREVREGAWLEGRPGALLGLHVEDEQGERLADLRMELGFRVSLLLPANTPLLVRTERSQAELRLETNQRLDFSRLVFRPAAGQARGGLDSALRQGLFATAFGPSYYRGFIDHEETLVPVPVATLDLSDEPPPLREPAGPSRLPAYVALGGAGVLAAGTAVAGVAAWQARRDFQTTNLERPADDAHRRFDRDFKIILAVGTAALISAGVSWLLWPRAQQP